MMLPKSILSYWSTLAITLLTQFLVGNFAAQIPLGLWNGKPSSDGIPVTELSQSNHRYKFTLPQRISSDDDATSNYNDELTVSWDADPGIKPATFHIQCWKNESVVHNDVSTL